MNGPATTIDRIFLVSSDQVARSSFFEHFFQSEVLKLRKDFEGGEELDCLVVPCSNGFGLKDGTPKDVQPLISSKLEKQVRAFILDNYCGEQPCGTAFILPVDAKSRDSKAHFSNICWVAVSRSIETLNKDYAYLSVWSALTTVRAHNRKIKEKKKRLNSVAIPGVTFRTDSVQDTCRQIAVAIKRFLEPPMEPLDKDEAVRYEETVIKPAAMTAEERSKELEGLLWSRELETRGICNEQELDIIVKWVNEGTDKDKRAHSLAAARAVVALLQRDVNEFTMRPEQICERIARKDTGCLPRLLDLGLTGELQLHVEIMRNELEISGKIGDGNAGSVYKGKYKGQDVAIKLFSKGTVSNSQDFKRELAMLSLIRHPLVITCNGGSTKPGDEFIVEELMEASVYDLLHDESFEMDMEMKLDFAISTALCMNFLHSSGLIHRDLKSLNLLVSKNYQVKICDFGLSRVIDSKSEMTKNIGTVAWIAPELFVKRHYTEKADVYSYGVILWELLTRKMPFGDIESFSIPLLVSRGERPPIPKDCSPEWKKLIKLCWHQKPQKRPDFKQILQRLRKMVDVRRPDFGFAPALHDNHFFQHLREERIAKGLDLNTERGLFLRNTSYITDDVYTGSSDDQGGPSRLRGNNNQGSSGRDTDSDYDEKMTSSSLSSLSLSISTSTRDRSESRKDRDR